MPSLQLAEPGSQSALKASVAGERCASVEHICSTLSLGHWDTFQMACQTGEAGESRIKVGRSALHTMR